MPATLLCSSVRFLVMTAGLTRLSPRVMRPRRARSPVRVGGWASETLHRPSLITSASELDGVGDSAIALAVAAISGVVVCCRARIARRPHGAACGAGDQCQRGEHMRPPLRTDAELARLARANSCALLHRGLAHGSDARPSRSRPLGGGRSFAVGEPRQTRARATLCRRSTRGCGPGTPREHPAAGLTDTGVGVCREGTTYYFTQVFAPGPRAVAAAGRSSLPRATADDVDHCSCGPRARRRARRSAGPTLRRRRRARRGRRRRGRLLVARRVGVTHQRVAPVDFTAVGCTATRSSPPHCWLS